MRGHDEQTTHMFSYLSPEQRVPADHPLRAVRALTDEALQTMSRRFASLYATTGRPSIPPEQLLRALLLQVLYTVRSERLLMEELNDNLLFRWFVGLNMDDPVWHPTTFTKNRDRLLSGDVAAAFFDAVQAHARAAGLLSDEHFTVDGTQLEAWASLKSFRCVDAAESDPPEDPGNPTVNFHGERRRNDTHQSTTDPEAMLHRKGKGKEAKLAYLGHVLLDNRQGLVANVCATHATGTAERDAAVLLLEASASPGSTVGADKGYDVARFVADAQLGMTHRETIRRLALFVASAIGGVLVLGPVSDVAAQSGSGWPPRSGWYVGGGIGPNWASGMDQEGWNRETTCYPTEACFDADPVPEVSGYRWRYDIASAAGAVFEISAGRIFDRTRLELSFAQRKNGLDQMFRSITDYDGVPMEARRGGSVVSNARNSIDHLTVRTLALNAYYDFPDAVGGISSYLGAGLGPAFVKVSGLHFSTDYQDTSGNAQAYDPPLSFYNSRQDVDLSDTVLAGHLHAGADYGLNAKTLLGLKLTYSMMGDIESTGGYSLHPFHERDPDFTNRNTFTDPHHWTLSFTVKFLFGN